MLRIFLLSLTFLISIGRAYATEQDIKQFIGYYQGDITVTADGKVKQASLKNTDSARLNTLIISQIYQWEFHPVAVNGKSVEAKAPFDLQVIATFGADKKIDHIEFRDVSIGKSDVELAYSKSQMVAPKQQFKRPSPTYPMQSLRDGYGAELKVAIEIGADGTVKQADVYNIALVGSGHRVDSRARSYALNNFGKSALMAIRKWQWSPEHLAVNACATGCISTITVQFTLENKSNWSTYADQKIELPVWARKSGPSALLDESNSWYVKLKTDPTNKKIAVSS
jgi:hypothetical protein